MKLKLETNPRNPLDLNFHLPSGANLMLAAPLADRWLFRVPISPSMALLAMPQFGGVEICVQTSGNCTSGLPYETNTAKLVGRLRELAPSAHAAHTLEAVKLLQQSLKQWRLGIPLKP